MRLLILSALMTGLTTSSFAAARTADGPQHGPWRATLETAGGELPFGMELRAESGALRVWIVNGPERVEIPRVERDGDTLVLGIDHYEAVITARLSSDGRQMDGQFQRRRGPDRWVEAKFAAVAGDAPRFAPLAAGDAQQADFGGRWRLSIGEAATPGVGLFEQADDGTVVGTFLTPGGDFGHCAGRADGARLRLSRFEGTHALLFDAKHQPDGTLAGEYWSVTGAHEKWTAKRDPEAEAPLAMERPRDMRADLDALTFRTVDGDAMKLSDPRLGGAALVIEILGTWCPNCHDAAKLMEEFHREYGGLGLAVVGLAFEVTGDFERDARLVRTYIERHKLTYPVLVAGRADKAEVLAKLPFLERLRAYPTTIFLDGRGRVAAIHSGFAGPATGALHEAQRRTFERMIEELLRADHGSQP